MGNFSSYSRFSYVKQCVVISGLCGLLIVNPLLLNALDRPTADSFKEFLTLSDAIKLALSQNPNLQSIADDIESTTASVIQAKLAPNPEIQYAIENIGGPSGDDLFLRQTLRLKQVLEIGGKRDHRRDYAVSGQQLAKIDFEIKKVDLAANVTQRFINVVAAQQSLSLTQRILDVAEQNYAVLSEQVGTGIKPAMILDDAMIQLSADRIFVETKKQELRTARQSLAATWGDQQPTFTKVNGDLETLVHVPELTKLIEILDKTPRINRWDNEIERRRQTMSLERSKLIPNIAVGAGIRQFPDANEVAAVVEFSAPLPLRNRNQGNIMISKVAINQAMAKKSDVEATNRELLVRAHTEFESARHEYKLFKQSTMSAARSLHQTTIDRYHQGEIDYLPVFSAERKLLEIELKMIAVGKRYHSAVAELDRLTMISPSKIYR